MKEVDTEDNFDYWLSHAKKGSKVVYFDGFLMFERQKFLMAGGEKTELPQKIRAAMAAWRAYLEDLVVLVQHKRSEGEYEYIAIRR